MLCTSCCDNRAIHPDCPGASQMYAKREREKLPHIVHVVAGSRSWKEEDTFDTACARFHGPWGKYGRQLRKTNKNERICFWPDKIVGRPLTPRLLTRAGGSNRYLIHGKIRTIGTSLFVFASREHANQGGNCFLGWFK